MRIKFEFTQTSYDMSIWIEDFPCRLRNGDVIDEGVLGKQYFDTITGEEINTWEVEDNIFSIDEKGIYQYVWLIIV